MTVTPSLGTLDRLPPSVARPGYGRADLSPGIVHIGVGNFHRAHQAVYLDDLFAKGMGRDWALIGAGVRPPDAAMRERLAAQDWLSTVVELAPGDLRARVCGAMVDFAPVEADNSALIAAMSDPRIRIVSLTVTEGGYFIDPATGEFDTDHVAIAADAAAPDRPGTAFGAILKALRRRREAGHPPFTVMSCDNLPGNGRVARATIAGLAELSDRGFAAWIRDEIAFPDGMVDRITPATTEPRRATLAGSFGIDDSAPVFCEPFRQWVLEDHFPQGRPPLEEVGVTFTHDVGPYELMKLRVLNGGHALIAYAGALLDLTYAHEAMAHPLVSGFLGRVEREEIVPIVPPPPGTDLGQYLATVSDRFANPEIGDTLARLCQDGSNRQPKFILPSTRDRIAQGLPVTGLALESALWCRYLSGPTEGGTPLAIDDPEGPRIVAAATRARTDPAEFLALRDLFGDLGKTAPFRDAFGDWLAALWRDGVAATLSRYLAA